MNDPNRLSPPNPSLGHSSSIQWTATLSKLFRQKSHDRQLHSSSYNKNLIHHGVSPPVSPQLKPQKDTYPHHDSIKQYKKIKVLGKGAYGKVWLARDQVTGLEVAIKEINAEEKKHHKKASSEFCIHSSLHHDNIVECLDLIEDAGDRRHVYTVFEYCEQGDLFHFIQQQPHRHLTIDQADCFFKQLILGIEYTHNHGVAHQVQERERET